MYILHVLKIEIKNLPENELFQPTRSPYRQLLLCMLKTCFFSRDFCQTVPEGEGRMYTQFHT